MSLALPGGVRGARRRAETDALIARMTVPPDAARVAAIDRLIDALCRAAIWEKLDCLWVLAAHDAQAARRNWIADRYNLAAVNAPVFTIDRGYASDGTTSYLATGYDPVAAALPITAGLGMWCRTHAVTIAVSGNQNFSLSPRSQVANEIRGRIAVDDYSLDNFGAVADSIGLTVAQRETATLVTGWRDGVQVGSATRVGTAHAASSLNLLALNNAGTAQNFDGRQYAACCVLRAPASAAEQAALHGAMRDYMTTVGAA